MSWGITHKIPFEIKAGWSIRYNLLGQKNAVIEEVNAYRKENELDPQRHPAQSFSHVKTDLEVGIKKEDPEILDLCRLWGIDPSQPLHKQNRAAVAAAWEAIKADLQPQPQ